MADWKDLRAVNRTVAVKTLSTGIWLAAERKVKVTLAKGSHFSQCGVHDRVHAATLLVRFLQL